MSDEKKEVTLVLVRTLKHNLKAKLTKEEYKQLKKHVKDSNGADGADIIDEMKGDAERQLDSWSDTVEEFYSDWYVVGGAD